jgi:DNA-3-methyladenine glycosylase I
VTETGSPPPDPSLPRCWMTPEQVIRDPVMAIYHDDEWGVPVDDETALFERLSLEAFQAGLSWSLILRKRDAFREAFKGFDPDAVAAFDERDVDRLLGDERIVRNRMKIEATISNARAILAMREAPDGPFTTFLRARFPPPPRRLPPTASWSDIPTKPPEAVALGKELAKRGFRFVGPSVVYSFIESVGLIDDHLPNCFRYAGPVRQ